MPPAAWCEAGAAVRCGDVAKCSDPNGTSTQFRFLRPDKDAEAIADNGYDAWSCVCKEADCWRVVGWKGEKGKPGRKRLEPEEPVILEGIPLGKARRTESGPRPP